MSSIYDWVAAYKKAGFNVIPCVANTKKPAVEWEQYMEKDIPLENTIILFKTNSNVGVTQHTVKFALIDFDSPRTMLDTLKDKLDITAKTLVANTNRGFHVLVKVRNHDTTGTIMKLNGGEIRFKGNTIVPPSEIDGVKRNWYYMSIEEAFYSWSNNNWDILNKLEHDSWLSYIENNEILEIDIKKLSNKLATPDLRQQLFTLLKPHFVEGNRHNFALAIASFLKYKLQQIGYGYDEALAFTKQLVIDLEECSAGEKETEDRIRAVVDTFENEITEHNNTLSTLLNEDYERLKELLRTYKHNLNEKLLDKVISDTVGYRFVDSSIVVVFSNTDEVELSATKLFNYVQLQYGAFFNNDAEELSFKKELIEAVKKKIARRRIREVKYVREGIHKISDTEFLIVFDEDNIYVYNTAFDDLQKIDKLFYKDTAIKIVKKLDDFDIPLFEKLMYKQTNELNEELIEIHAKLRDRLKHWNFEKPYAASALASLIIALPVHTAWSWRPLIHIIGSKGVGKTTLLREIFMTIYPSLCTFLNRATVAGIMQEYSNTSYVLLLDNFEKTQRQKEDFFTMLEAASSGYTEKKGTKEGAGITYSFKNLVVISGVIDFAVREALDSRIVQIALLQPKKPKARQFTEIEAKEIATYSLAFSLKNFSKMQQIYNETLELGREYQNIAYMHAVDRILFEEGISEYAPILERSSVEPEERQFIRELFNITLKLGTESVNVAELLMQLNEEHESSELAQIRKKIEEISKYGFKVSIGQDGIFVGLDYICFIANKLISRDITETTFKRYLAALNFTMRKFSVKGKKKNLPAATIDEVLRLLGYENG
ncbi:MAG: bifunctional DNA primase/polymerase [Archaeoglobaceae archaeon]